MKKRESDVNFLDIFNEIFAFDVPCILIYKLQKLFFHENYSLFFSKIAFRVTLLFVFMLLCLFEPTVLIFMKRL